MSTLRLALIADTHCDESSRFVDHNRIMDWIGVDAARRGVDLFVHAGDVWERRSSSRERIAVADWAQAWAETAPLVVISGNHCDPLDTEWLGRLRGRHAISSRYVPGVERAGGFAVCCLPWPNKARLLAGLDAGREHTDDVAREALRNILRGFSLDAQPADEPRILLAHAMVDGSRTSVSQPPLVGQDLVLSLGDLSLAGADFVALGHIHLGQDWATEGERAVPVVYPGSPRRCNFGEAEPKGYVVATFEGRRCVGWERIETPCPPMLHLAGAFEDGALRLDPLGEGQDLAGAEVRLRYDFPSEDRQAARAAAEAEAEKLRGLGAIVKVEDRPIIVTRARAPEVATAASVADKLTAFWASKDDDPGERRAPLLAKLDELEGA